MTNSYEAPTSSSRNPSESQKCCILNPTHDALLFPIWITIKNAEKYKKGETIQLCSVRNPDHFPVYFSVYFNAYRLRTNSSYQDVFTDIVRLTLIENKSGVLTCDEITGRLLMITNSVITLRNEFN